MSTNMATPGDEEMAKISLYNSRHFAFHGYTLPFAVIYAIWLYGWTMVYGVDDYWEPGLIAFVGIGLVQIIVCLFCYWSVHVRTFLTCNKSNDIKIADLVKVEPTANNGSPGLLYLRKVKDSSEVWFIFQKKKYVCDPKEKKLFSAVRFPTEEPIEFYMKSKGLESEEAVDKERKYGTNALDMDIPSFMELFMERATAPFFVFQVFCVGLWCLDEFWYYSLFTLAMLVMFEATLVQQQLRNMNMIREMGNKPYPVMVYRDRKWRPIPTEKLIPGDLVSLVRSVDERLVPCDIILLRGSCIIDEAMLTGESVPVMKECIEELEGDQTLDMQTDGKLHILSGGTKIIQHSAPTKNADGIKAPNGGCIGYVLQTGFNTSQGRLLRTILYSVKRVTANNLETFLFIMFLLIFAIAASAYVWIKGTEDPDRNRYKLFLECTLILTSVVPPELPIELSLAVNSSLLALTKLYVYCTEPFRIPFAGKIDICCFDKTGTLTSDNIIVEGITACEGAEPGEMVRLCEAPLKAVQVAASCHSLVFLNEEIVGDPLEKVTLKDAEWHLTKADAVTPKKRKTPGLKIAQRFHFSSALKRMSVICSYSTVNAETSYMVAVKGAPETLEPMFKDKPADYRSRYNVLAQSGARVLALGYKGLGTLSHQQVRDMKRGDVEKDLEFVGFIAYSCPLKGDSKAVIKELLDSSHHVMMITGDNPLTACHVARELRMCRKPTTLVLTAPNAQESAWHWESVDKTMREPYPKRGAKLHKQYDLCATGEGMDFLTRPENVHVMPSVKVFARVAPKQKELVITTLKAKGYVTLMCGDGTNDVGALKHAEVGVALLANAPESIKALKKTMRPPKSAESSQTNQNDKVSSKIPKSSGGSGGRAAKMRAISRGEDTTADAKVPKQLAAMMKDIEEEEKASVVRLGDASIASPFTSRLSTAACVCHIIKQGRCTLVTTLQMFKILALNALVLAYTQSVLYLDGIRFSDGQATFQGLLLAGCFLFISRSKPLKHLSKERPLTNIFNIYTILTVLCQFAIHFTTLIYLSQEVHARTVPREGKFVDLEKKFEPNLLNSTMYCISVALQIATFAVNYKGPPFMESLWQNKPLLYSLFFSYSMLAMLTTGIAPEFSEYFEIIEFPEDFRIILLRTLALNAAGVLCIDKLCEMIFYRTKLKAV